MAVNKKKKFNEVLFNNICTDIATSDRGLHTICDKYGIQPVTFYRWIANNEEMLHTYARARDAQADYLADQILEIADDSTHDTKTIQKGRELVEVENTEWINRSRLRVDARKWIAAKLKPKKYGDKMDVTTDGEKITSVKVEFVPSPIPLAFSEKDVKLE